MAWMMDQLASIGVAFYPDTIDKIFEKSVRYFFDHPRSSGSDSESSKRGDAWDQWADSPIYDEHKPVRPWGLGEIVQPDTGFYRLAGRTTRTPGMYRRIDSKTGRPTDDFLANTNEKIHRSVRLRLTFGGLGYDDVGLYKCRALLKKGPWDLQQVCVVATRDIEVLDGGSPEVVEELEENLRWGWVYGGSGKDAPPRTVMMEEGLGPYEKRLLRLNKGMVRFNSQHPVSLYRVVDASDVSGRPFYANIVEGSRR